MDVVRKFGAHISKEEQKDIQMTFVGNEPSNSRGQSINIARIYDQHFNEQYQKMYAKVDVCQPTDGTEPKDEMGYLGMTKWQRDNVKMAPIKETEFLRVICSRNQQ